MALSKARAEFSYKLRTIRSQKHLTQKQLADSLGISTKTLSHYEHYGKPCPTIMKRITLMFPDEFNDSLYKILDFFLWQASRHFLFRPRMQFKIYSGKYLFTGSFSLFFYP